MRVTETGRAARGARHRRRRADAASARPARPGRRAAAAGRRGSGYRAPPPTHRGRRAPLRRQPANGRCCSCSRTCTGRTPRRSSSCATWRGWPGDARLLLLATFRDTGADMPEALSETLADLRRSRRRPAAEAYGALRHGDRRVHPARRRTASSGPRLCEPARAIRDLTDGNAFLVCELWRALVETGSVEVAHREDPVRAAPGGARQLPTASARWSGQRLSRLAPRDHRAARARRHRRVGVRPGRGAAAPPASPSRSSLARPGRGGWRAGSSRSSRPRVWRAASPMSSCGGRLYDRLTRARRAELHLRVGEALEGTGEASGSGARRPRASLRRRRPARRSGARRSSTTCARRMPRPTRSPSTRPQCACAPRSSWVSRTRSSGRRPCSSSAP